ncbi:pyroglutamyl-peptidase I [Alkalihalophilus marmarensis]|jgi:pyroglutamyl-peptidase|uniref:pyroglutamyl-peptidase I n=1 Tax=Alkalihalophilus marmarensis TaxID=521377 RepID=UPI00203C5D5F|nr:pyroglutamyl-peptidase I [Alkalihalophilus marmarensis]MCM3489827.1 pyroglutamyl-peptidase I [Alkalihalophilus marmarensis]
MKKLLISGFEPFLGHKVNPTKKIVEALDGRTIGEFEITAVVLPVEFDQSAKALLEHVENHNPDVVISLGLAAGRHLITPERIAINCNDGDKDNKGYVPQDEPINEGGPDAYLSTLPIRRFVERLKEEGYPAEISNTAGTYLCNNVMYNVLDYIASGNKDMRSGFIHIPASFDLMLTNPKLPGWSNRDLLFAVELMIEEL